MRYVSGLPALNLGDRTLTPGDWHHSAMDWEHPFTLDTADSPYGYWGINDEHVPGHGMMPVANHIRACLDMIALGYFGDVQGMRDGFLANPATDGVVMHQVWKLRGRDNWHDIDRFMGREYATRWLRYKHMQYGKPGKAMSIGVRAVRPGALRGHRTHRARGE